MLVEYGSLSNIGMCKPTLQHVSPVRLQAQPKSARLCSIPQRTFRTDSRSLTSSFDSNNLRYKTVTSSLIAITLGIIVTSSWIASGLYGGDKLQNDSEVNKLSLWGICLS